MSPSDTVYRPQIIVVHHDALVLEDLCETLKEALPSATVDRAEALAPDDLAGLSHDAALIEVSRNATALGLAGDALTRAFRWLIWITDALHPLPDQMPSNGILMQPFRSGDVVAVLQSAGVLSPSPPGALS